MSSDQFTDAINGIAKFAARASSRDLDEYYKADASAELFSSLNALDPETLTAEQIRQMQQNLKFLKDVLDVIPDIKLEPIRSQVVKWIMKFVTVSPRKD